LPTVFVISEDWTLRAAVRAELLEHGMETLGFDCVEDALRAAADGHWPALVLADDSVLEPGKPELTSLLRRSSLLLITSGTGAAPDLPPGAMVLRRPVRVGEITARVRQILEGQPA
jgi:DNA-binding response OmpR family regulator